MRLTTGFRCAGKLGCRLRGIALAQDKGEGDVLQIFSFQNLLWALPFIQTNPYTNFGEVVGKIEKSRLDELLANEPVFQLGIYQHVENRQYYLLQDVLIDVREPLEWAVLYTTMYVHPEGGPGQYTRPPERFDQRFEYVGDELPAGV